MFKVATTPTYVWPVKIDIPTDGGITEKHTFDAQFKRLPQADIDRMVDGLADRTITEDAAVRSLIIGWNGVMDERDSVIPFSEAALARLMQVYPVRGCIVDAWYDSLKAARRKN